MCEVRRGGTGTGWRAVSRVYRFAGGAGPELLDFCARL
jgi:hypothetical protein